MSKAGSTRRMTISKLAQSKAEKKKLVMTTCYDAAFARLVDQSEIDLILVGDSAGNVVMGYDSTIPVTLDDMVRMTRAVTLGAKRPFIVADMPFLTYGIEVAETIRNAKRLIQEGGAQAIKLEGGAHIADHVKALVKLGIPVVGHLGLTPQSIHQLGGHRVQGREMDAAEKLIADAHCLVDSGACALVLELVPGNLAKRVTDSIPVPTIGIGAGNGCDGQVLVLHDLLGFDPDFCPKFMRKYANLSEVVVSALNAYSSEVTSGQFPSDEQTF